MSKMIKPFARVFAVAVLAPFSLSGQVPLAGGPDPHALSFAQTSQKPAMEATAAREEGARTNEPKPYIEEKTMPYLRWSELEIDPARLNSFKTLAEENVRETRRTEPSVLAFYWAAEKDHPNRIHVFEAYADANAYQAHLQSPHFQKFRTGSGQLVTNRQLFEAVPVMLGAKPQSPSFDALVRIAELEIDPSQLDAYRAIVSEEIEASVRVEPGVFAIYAFALKDRPNHLRFYEIYADERAYLLHRETPHFRKYLDATQGMITARKLIETASASSLMTGQPRCEPQPAPAGQPQAISPTEKD